MFILIQWDTPYDQRSKRGESDVFFCFFQVSMFQVLPFFCFCFVFFWCVFRTAELITFLLKACWLEEELVFPPKYNDNAGKNLRPGLQKSFSGRGCLLQAGSNLKQVQGMIDISRHDRQQLTYTPIFKNVSEVPHLHSVLSLQCRTPSRVFFS